MSSAHARSSAAPSFCAVAWSTATPGDANWVFPRPISRSQLRQKLPARGIYAAAVRVVGRRVALRRGLGGHASSVLRGRSATGRGPLDRFRGRPLRRRSSTSRFWNACEGRPPSTSVEDLLVQMALDVEQSREILREIHARGLAPARIDIRSATLIVWVVTLAARNGTPDS